jgi:hypothetical protein
MWAPTTGQKLNGRGPAFLVALDPATIYMNFAFPDERGWYAQKTPWVISREYEGALLVRAARIDRRGPVRFARGYGEHLRELYWEAGADQSLVPEPEYRFLASSTLVRARGCYALPDRRQLLQQDCRRPRSRLTPSYRCRGTFPNTGAVQSFGA